MSTGTVSLPYNPMNFTLNPEWVGIFAAFLTTAAYIPQVVKVFRHRDTKSLSTGMYAILTCGLAAWFVYGVLIGSPSMIYANGITFLMSLYILLMKRKHG